ncbi:hypothetical protein FA13DRAFT_94625 [Coprinellus micaceus]|uniref:DUF6533 domain-containing protein n=1 Tax=Coprinellus micaceus TaxID=71717 RepID=A0A4Y7SIV4_COPMI|nr:hypothetical protein FA13DRAFT_94625 [Coprinellus micaceus]
MDPEISPEIISLLPVYEALQISQFAQLPTIAALLYHYVFTLDDEVSQIWPQPTWKTGKILFLAIRYTGIVYMTSLLAVNWPHHHEFSVPLQGCEALGVLVTLAVMLTRTFAEAALWLCLYALLGGKPKYFYLLAIGFLVLTIPAVVLTGMGLMSQRAIPRNILDSLLGYPCSFLPPQRHLLAIGSYIVLARASLALVVGLVILFVRYRKQNHNLIKVIRQEGGIFYISTLILMFFSCLTVTPRSPVKDSYNIVSSLKTLFVYVFADRLLLRLKKVDDRSTHLYPCVQPRRARELRIAM